jgi:hypothetical protein
LTSYVHTGVYEVDFSEGHPVYVEAVMPPCDGCLQVTEAVPKVESHGKGGNPLWWERSGHVSAFGTEYGGVFVERAITTEAYRFIDFLCIV